MTLFPRDCICVHRCNAWHILRVSFDVPMLILVQSFRLVDSLALPQENKVNMHSKLTSDVQCQVKPVFSAG